MVGIISAMPEEIQVLLQDLKDVSISTKGMRKYHQGILYNKKVVLVFSRWGKVASAATTAQLINDFSLDEIIFTGVAGSISENTNIGDIIVGRNLYQYDMDASPLVEPFKIPILQKLYFETNKTNRDLLLKASSLFLSQIKTNFNNSTIEQFNIERSKAVIGDIGSGDQFISTVNKSNQIKTNLPTIICVEMEGAAVAQVCYEYQIPFSIIRTISDKANDNAHIDFPKFAKVIASKYAHEVLRIYFDLKKKMKLF